MEAPREQGRRGAVLFGVDSRAGFVLRVRRGVGVASASLGSLVIARLLRVDLEMFSERNGGRAGGEFRGDRLTQREGEA